MINDKYFSKCITFGRAKEGLRADFQNQLKELQKEIGFEYVRFHGLFHDDMAVYDEDEDGNPVLWFGYIDKLFDFLLSVNIKPFVELGFMPSKIASFKDTVFWWHANGSPPTDYDKWHILVKETVSHLTQRYGANEVGKWYFEVWNEPNLSSFFHGTKDEYFKLYEVTADAVKSVCENYLVGGPSTSGADFRENLSYLKAFIEFCSNKNLPVDFFSAHPYPTCWALDEEGTEHMGYISREICGDFFDNIRKIVDASPYSGAEIHLTEWNSSPSPRDLIHDTPFMAPFILYNITQNFEKIDSLGFWTFTDVFEENGPGKIPFHGGFGLVNADGLKKPSYWAYWFLNKLGQEVVELSDNHIVTKQDNDYQVIIWNYCYYKDNFAQGDRSELSETDRDNVFENKSISVELNIELNGEYKQTEYILNKNTSAFHNWVLIGAPKYLTPQQIKILDKKSRPIVSFKNIFAFKFNEILEPQEVRMYTLNKV